LYDTWFRGGLVFKAHRLVYHSTLGLRVIKKKKKKKRRSTIPAIPEGVRFQGIFFVVWTLGLGVGVGMLAASIPPPLV